MIAKTLVNLYCDMETDLKKYSLLTFLVQIEAG